MALSFLSYWLFSPSSSSTLLFSCLTSCTKSCRKTKYIYLGKQYIISTSTGFTNRKSIQISGACQQPYRTYACQHIGELNTRFKLSAVIRSLQVWTELWLIKETRSSWNKHHKVQLSTGRKRMNPEHDWKAFRLHICQPIVISVWGKPWKGLLLGTWPIHLVRAGGSRHKTWLVSGRRVAMQTNYIWSHRNTMLTQDFQKKKEIHDQVELCSKCSKLLRSKRQKDARVCPL